MSKKLLALALAVCLSVSSLFAISSERAQKIAMDDAKEGKVFDLKVEKGKDGPGEVYEVRFSTDRYDYRYVIGEKTGKIIKSTKTEKPKAPGPQPKR